MITKNEYITCQYPKLTIIWEELNRLLSRFSHESSNNETENEKNSIKVYIMGDLLNIVSKQSSITEKPIDDFVVEMMDLFGDEGIFLINTILDNLNDLESEMHEIRVANKDKLEFLKQERIDKSNYYELSCHLFSHYNSSNSEENLQEKNRVFRNDVNANGNQFSKCEKYSQFENLIKSSIPTSNVVLTRAENFEKVFIPANSIPDSISTEMESQLIPIQTLNENFRVVFGDLKKFNYVQSKVFNSVFLSVRNILVAAPTGSGKTNIALLAILRSISLFTGIGDADSDYPAIYKTPDTNKFKIVYIAPMKSLVSEITKKYAKSLKPLGIKVLEVTSDETVTKEWIDKHHIIVTVPEKFDIMTRTITLDGHNEKGNLLDTLQCLILDEIHMLGDERGPSVEAIVSRILFNVEITQRPIRLVGLSATLPNWEDFASFLNVDKKDAFFFDQIFRPTPLEKTIIGIYEKRTELKVERAGQKRSEKKITNKDLRTKNKDLIDERMENESCKKNTSEEIRSISDVYNSTAFDIVLECLKKNEQVLVFVHSRSETLSTALYFKKRLCNSFQSDSNQTIQKSEIVIKTLNKNQFNAQSKSTEEIHKNEQKFNMKSKFDKNYYIKMLRDCRNSSIKDLFEYGLGIHHAGLISNERKLTEALFSLGLIRVLFTTATLAWGVNLPARHVIIKGTNVYDTKKGKFRDLGILDIFQIFGRAGRPQFESLGSAYMITSSDKVQSYFRKLTFQAPIESQLLVDSNLCNLLNSEISRGSILNLNDAKRWLQYTFLVTRAKKDPLKYGLTWEELTEDPNLSQFCYLHAEKCLELLYQSKLIRYNKIKEEVSSTHYGKLVSNYYINFNTANIFRKCILEPDQNSSIISHSDFDILQLIGEASEFSNMTVREEEINELEVISRIPQISGAITKQKLNLTKVSSKVAILIIAYTLRIELNTPTLIMDSIYISQNGVRILRFIFEMVQLSTHGVSEKAQRALEWSKMLEMRIMYSQSILRHFAYFSSLNKSLNSQELLLSERAHRNSKYKGPLKVETVKKLENFATWDAVRELSFSELKGIVFSDAEKVFEYIRYVPNISFREVTLSPINKKVAKLGIKLIPNWRWSERWHGVEEKFHLWISNPQDGTILYTQRIKIQQKNMNLLFSISDIIPIPDEDLPFFLNIQIISNKWVNLDFEAEINLRLAVESFNKSSQLQEYILPSSSIKNVQNSIYSVQDVTELLKVKPIPLNSLKDNKIIKYYNNKGIFFLNPIQSQLFHILFHTDENIFLGAPTGSGKTMVAEIAIFKILLSGFEKNDHATIGDTKTKEIKKIIYIAPLKSLARERVEAWKELFSGILGLGVVLITGNSKVSLKEIKVASIIISTPEKWESIMRRWWTPSKSFIRDIRLMIFDEVHLVGQDPRGSVVESIVCKTKFVNRIFEKYGINKRIRILSLSTPLSNAKELSSWLEVNASGYFNFSPAIRPVPCTVYISGFQEKNYCPRMASMNRPIYNKIIAHSPKKPVIIFVASRRQTRITALSLSHICFCNGEPNRFLNTDTRVNMDTNLKNMIKLVKDKALKQTLESGIGIHHAGLHDSDRNLVESLFLRGLIQIIVATSTLAWGVNFPAHLAIIKGTEYFDAKLGQYVDYPITDILQMIGRAGRPQFDSQSTACIMTIESKKSFYKRFLYDPLPLESCFGVSTLIEIFNAEVASLAITSIPDAICFLSNSFFFKRVISNPAFYDPNIFQIENSDIYGKASITELSRPNLIVYILEKMIVSIIDTLVELECIKVSKIQNDDGRLEMNSKFISISKNFLNEVYEKLVKENVFESRNTEIDIDSSCDLERFTWSSLCPKIFKDIQIHSNSGPLVSLSPTLVGQISSFFYVKCGTLSKLNLFLRQKSLSLQPTSWAEVLSLVSHALEFEIHPVRHNEDKTCAKMSHYAPLGKIPYEQISSPYQKVFLLLQAYIFSIQVPVIDFINDINSILEQVPRILHAFIQLNKLGNYLSASSFNSILLVLQCINQKIHPFNSSLHQLPNFSNVNNLVSEFKVKSLYEFSYKATITKEININSSFLVDKLYIKQLSGFLDEIPLFELQSKITNSPEHGNVNILVRISILNDRVKFPSDFFDLSWFSVENVMRDKLIFLEKLNRSEFKFDNDMRSFYCEKGISLELDANSKIKDYKVSISSEKYLGIKVSYLFD
ncbi:activating signal cointegrator 1 complex subunit 3 [Cryptosporidium felis]|nr:activating signal cointegrator 1 complex subunit 3 [Cryptosporidium felis]